MSGQRDQLLSRDDRRVGGIGGTSHRVQFGAGHELRASVFVPAEEFEQARFDFDSHRRIRGAGGLEQSFGAVQASQSRTRENVADLDAGQTERSSDHLRRHEADFGQRRVRLHGSMKIRTDGQRQRHVEIERFVLAHRVERQRRPRRKQTIQTFAVSHDEHTTTRRRRAFCGLKIEKN